ncbi:MAG TPA: MerR family transcriptional regulator, partial [Haloplasmataceae bacterium]
MEYTINKLSQMAKISSRTLRYYDEIGLLKPKRINFSGYRIYGEEEINILQQILFYKELGVELSIIKNIINNPHFNALEALESHRQNLLIKKKQIDTLLENVNNTIAYYEGRIKMSDKEKFQGFKEELIAE